MIEVQVVCSSPVAEVESLVTRAAEAALRRCPTLIQARGVSVVLADMRYWRTEPGVCSNDGPTDVLSFEFDGDDPGGEIPGIRRCGISVARPGASQEAATRSSEKCRPGRPRRPPLAATTMTTRPREEHVRPPRSGGNRGAGCLSAETTPSHSFRGAGVECCAPSSSAQHPAAGRHRDGGDPFGLVLL